MLVNDHGTRLPSGSLAFGDAPQSGVTSNTWVIELGPACPVSPERSSSVRVGAGGQSRVLMTKAQSTPSPRDTASEDAPGVLPERAQVPFAGRGPLPHTACK